MSGAPPSIDIRLPLGLMFAVVGLVLLIFGIVTNSDPIYAQHSLGININLWWGLALTLFGVFLLILVWLAARKQKSP
jgi:magnesium-transporting ATPase (P-type)